MAALALGIGLGTGAPPIARRTRFETRAIVGRPVVGNAAEARHFDMADSVSVYGTQYFLPSRGTIVVQHGLGAHDAIAMQVGDSLRRATGMNVLFLDLRGNGRSGGARGRLAHDAQYGDDIADVVRELKRRNPSGPVLLVGVRQGAGPMLAFAARPRNPQQPRAQGIVLIEPILTLKALVLAGTQDGSAFQWHTRRLRTQQVLNVARLHFADRLPVAYQLAQQPDGPTARTFSWRAIRTLLPQDPWAIANGIALPLLLIDRASAATSPLRRTDLHEVATLPVGTSLWATATWRILENWTAQFSADAASPANILPYAPIPLTDTTR